MPVTFLNPALLLGLVAAAVPVIIHFLSRRRTRRVEFSDLRFLMEEEVRQARRRGVQRWLLLLLRVLAVSCLALAAARPHWGGLPGGAGRATLFVIDASASMQAQQEDGRTRFAAAVELAGDLLQALPDGSSVQAILAGAAARPLFATWLPAGSAARAALSVATVLDGPGDLAAALRESARQVREAPVRPVEVVLLSDLQAGEHPQLAAACAELEQAGARLLIRRLGDGVPGGGVVSVELPGRALRPGETAEIAAVVRPERAGQSFWLELDGRRVAESVAPTPATASGSVTVTFPVTVPLPGLHTGRLGKDPDRLPVDDARPFVLVVPDRLEVLLAHGADRDALGRGGWRYLARALDPAGDSRGLFRVRSVVADSLLDGDLGGVDLLVLVDTGALGRRLGESLRQWLAGGGAIFVVDGDPEHGPDLGASLLPLVDLPRQAAWTVREDAQAERARVVDPGHPVLAGLGDASLEALGAARWWRYWTLAEGEARVLLAADSGAPLLLEGELDNGRWALLPFHLRRDATDLMLNPLFLPLVQRVAARLATGAEPAANLEVGHAPVLRLTPHRLRLRPGATAAQIDVLAPPDGRPGPAALAWHDAVPVLSAPPSERSGFYVFRAAGDTLGAVAVAVPASESEPRVETPDELARRLREAGLTQVVDLGQTSAAGFVRALAGRDLARWLLGLALGLLGAELWLGRRVRAGASRA
ncbi:MAG TPA: BatA domain-containing protein [Candidatus Krumholzibacteria bacterium]|nr:BatA domain-containing protein [Candidatus Krumholzibacteria bacterium]HPD72312.1 BatA domain-containing protein [Candidatus Krumholzibacteria bacterium]HRY40756.1 BatA domain-containing protein [Candidatus Krumholzibacteria bacterium]